MTYTNEERAAMRDAAEQIYEYLKGLQPQVRESIKIPFGEITTRRGDYGFPVREREFEIVVSNSWIGGWSGGLRYTFEHQAENSCFEVTVYSPGHGISFTAALMHEWQRVKREILMKIADQSARASAVKNFRL